jgi:uncharacterized protein YndB with AHSA1/START domain
LAQVVVSTVIARPREEVFAYYEQYDRHPEWQPELIRAELTTPAPVAVGTRGIEVRRLLGRETAATYEITEHDPPRRSAFRVLDGPIRPSGLAKFEPEAGGTRMTFELDLGARGPLRLLAPLLAPRLRRQTTDHLRRFASIVGDLGQPS